MNLSTPLISQKSQALTGKILTEINPNFKSQNFNMADKSISHRALMLSTIAQGISQIDGLLESEDVLATKNALINMGADITQKPEGGYQVRGAGLPALLQPKQILNLGNSGTSARLLMGLLSGTGHQIVMTGDASLNQRPMQRVIEPLKQMGVEFSARTNQTEGDFLPVTFRGRPPLIPIDYRLPMPSAQVKSAILLAGLSALGKTIIRQPEICRDHTERMLQHYGADLTIESKASEKVIILRGLIESATSLKACNLTIPRDISSVAFPLVAAIITRDSHIVIDNVGINPTRDGLLETLLQMGADITITTSYQNKQNTNGEKKYLGEPTAELTIRHGPLKAITTPANIAPRMIDEYPILAIAAATAHGVSVFQGLKELKIKESDRLNAIASGLSQAGVLVKTGADWLEITGHGIGTGYTNSNKAIRGGTTITTALDHRIAMSFLILGLITEKPIIIDNAASIATSFPDFLPLMQFLGANIKPHQPSLH